MLQATIRISPPRALIEQVWSTGPASRRVHLYNDRAAPRRTYAALAYFALDGFQTSTINWQTFSQVAFAFTVTPELLVAAIVWAAGIGLLGGLFPAIRAARLPIATALREV